MKAWLHRSSVWLVTLLVLGTYAISITAALRHVSAQEFIHLGRIFVNRSQASPTISSRAATYHYDGDIGFDGQFAYYLAVDPARARYYMDSPAYRYTRVLYPITARVMALGNPDLVPVTLLVLNLLMIGVGTAALAIWLRRHHLSAWFAAIYGFYPGVLITLQRDTTETMAYSLVAVAVLLFNLGGRAWLLSSVVFALAILSRETAAIFAVGYTLCLLLAGEGTLRARIRANLWRAVIFGTISALPLVAWKVFLRLWLGSFGLDGKIERIPFHGIASWYPWTPGQVDEVRIIVIPAVLCGIAVAFALWRGMRQVEIWMLLANVIILVVLLERPAWNDISSAGRITTGVGLAAVLALPFFSSRMRAWIWSASVLWLSPMVFWFFIPIARTVFGSLRHRL